MKFGNRVRQLRQDRALTQRQLAALLDVTFTYISKVENEKLNAGDYPSEAFVLKLAKALDADPDELLLLTERVPVAIRKRITERPDVFRELAAMTDKELDQLMHKPSKTK